MAGVSRPRWGWHKLDRRWADLIVAEAHVAPRDVVLDIGAGTGVVTASLLKRGAKVIAVELHHRRCGFLRERFSGADVITVRTDASDLRLPKQPFRVVANPPFAIVKPIVKRVVAPGSRLIRADLVVPRHIAREWASQSARGTAHWTTRFSAQVGRTVPRRAFHPPVARDAVVLTLERLPYVLEVDPPLRRKRKLTVPVPISQADSAARDSSGRARGSASG